MIYVLKHKTFLSNIVNCYNKPSKILLTNSFTAQTSVIYCFLNLCINIFNYVYKYENNKENKMVSITVCISMNCFIKFL